MKRISNHQLRDSLNNEYRTAFSGRYSIFFDTLWRYTWRTLPLGVKFLVRKNIGSMTFSWGMIFFAAVWARFILEGYLSMEESTSVGNLAEAWGYFQDYGPVLKVLGIVIAGLMKFLFCIVDFIPFSIINNEELVGKPQYFYPFFVSALVFIMGAVHKNAIAEKHEKKIPFDPLHHGDSIFVLGFLRIASFFKNTEAIKQKAMEKQRVIEIFVLGVFIYLSWLLGERWAFLSDLAGFLLIGTVALIFENKSIKRQLQKDVEAQLATDFRAKRIQEAYQSYYEKDIDIVATVSSVSKYEIRQTSTQFTFPKGATVHSG